MNEHQAPNNLKSKPVCLYCHKEIEVSNPLEFKDGHAHRACFAKGVIHEIGLDKL